MSKPKTTLIAYDPTPANAGHCWEFHAAPEWEKQVQAWSLFFYSDGSLFVPIKKICQ